MFLFVTVFRIVILLASFAPVVETPRYHVGGGTALSVSRWGSSPSFDLSAARWGSTPSYELSTARVGSSPSVALSVARYGSTPSVALQVVAPGSTAVWQRSTCTCSSYGTLLPFFVACVSAALFSLGSLVVAQVCASGLSFESHAPITVSPRRRTKKIDPPEAPLPEVAFEWPAEWPEAKVKEKKPKKVRKRVRGGAKNKH